MEKLAVTEVVGLIEAYNAVYTPQINEEQVWGEVETWVNSLIEEGYDLSDYTWEDMYEKYITEISVNLGGQKAVDAVKTRSTQQQQSASQLDNARARRFGSGSYRTAAPTKPPVASLPSSARQVTQYPKGVSTGVGGGNAGASTKVGPKIVGPKIVGTGANRSTPATKPVPTAKSAPTPSAPKSTTAIAFDKNTPNLAATKKPSISSAVDDLKTMQAASRQRQGLTQSFDVFDAIKGHLIDEGYADTEESATAIMANMSGDWRDSIVEAMTKKYSN